MFDTLARLLGVGPEANAHMVIHGQVYYGGYLHYIQNAVQNRGLRGYMRGAYDPLSLSIELEVQGGKPKIEGLLADLRQGPCRSAISKVEVLWQPVHPNMSDFRVYI